MATTQVKNKVGDPPLLFWPCRLLLQNSQVKLCPLLWEHEFAENFVRDLSQPLNRANVRLSVA